MLSKQKQSLFVSICLLWFQMVLYSNSQPVLMTEDIGALIFEERQYFLIYVYELATPSVLQMFNSYCGDRSNCTILNATVEEYQSVRKFIGKEGKEFFLILNVPFEKKYVLDINASTITVNDLADFQKGYQDLTLEPFQASEMVPVENSQIYTELVGRTFQSFLKGPAILKVIYTYTKHEACEGCIALLKDFIALAEKMHNKEVLKFGYVDVFLNDIFQIHEPIVPHFYIYQGEKIIKEIKETDYQELPQILMQEVNRVTRKSSEGNEESISSESTEGL